MTGILPKLNDSKFKIFINLALLFYLASFSNALITQQCNDIIEEECLNYTVYPVQYELTITPYIYSSPDSYYSCDVLITVIANEPDVRLIELDAKDIEIGLASVKVSNEDRNIASRHEVFHDKLRIYLSEPMVPYRERKIQYIIRIYFRKIVNVNSPGIFIVPYEDEGTKQLFATRLSPNKAKNFFPCFDNPRFEAIFKFRVYQIKNRRPEQLSNTSLVIAEEQSRQIYHGQQGEYILIEYKASPQVALHQVGFHHSQFGSRQTSTKCSNDVIVIWAPTRKLKNYDYILNFSDNILSLVIGYGNCSRPLVQGPINIVSLPEKMDGYEVGSWNLLTNSEVRLAYSPHFTSIGQEEQMTYELALQLSRIWLGNPGEPDKRTRWIEEWFKEGVATYLTIFFLTQYQQGVRDLKYKMPIGMYGLQMKHKAMTEDCNHRIPALHSFERMLAVEIPDIYREFVQMKTASLLWMVENWIGSDKFHAAFVKYISAKRGKFISLCDFLNNLDRDTAECQHQFLKGITPSKILYSWFHQNGYPVIQVNVLRQQTPNVIHLKQHKFSFNKNRQEDRDSHYLIPISYIVKNNKNCFNCYRPRFVIEDTDYSFEENLNGEWIILNANASGYYRVNYDLYTWKLIAKTLREDRLSIPEQNRAQIVNDVFALYAAGELDQALAVEILNYLEHETSSVVWEAAISGFEFLNTENAIASCQMHQYKYSYWKEFMRAKVAPIYEQVAGCCSEHYAGRMFRRNIVSFACALEYQLCINAQKQLYTRGHRLDRDTRQTCYEVQLKSDQSNFIRRGFNEFEVEDKYLAERRLSKERHFMSQLPLGRPEMDKLMSSSTEFVFLTPTPMPAAQQPPGAGSATHFTSSIVLVITVLTVLIVR